MIEMKSKLQTCYTVNQAYSLEYLRSPKNKKKNSSVDKLKMPNFQKPLNSIKH